jgi:RNA polymerase sigma factor (sigma-70 family)
MNDAKYSDAELIVSFYRGDNLSYNVLHQKWFPKLSRYLATQVSENDAEDLAENILIKVYYSKQRTRYDPERGSFNTWIFKIAKNTLIDFLRKENIEVLFSDLASIDDEGQETSFEPTDPADLQDLVELKQVFDIIIQYLNQMPDSRLKKAVEMYCAGYKGREIEAELGVGWGQAGVMGNNLIHEGLRDIRDYIAARGYHFLSRNDIPPNATFIYQAKNASLVYIPKMTNGG